MPINLNDPIFDLTRRMELKRVAVGEVRRKRADAQRVAARRDLEREIADARRNVAEAEAAHEHRRLPPGARPNREVEIARERLRRLLEEDGPAKLRQAEEAAKVIEGGRTGESATITSEEEPPNEPKGSGGRWG